MSIAVDIQKLEPGGIVELFELDATAIGGTIMWFHSGTSEISGGIGPVYWQGKTYQSYPVEASGFEWSGRGTLPRPKVKVANISGVISALCLNHDDLVNAKLTRKRTFVKYLDAANFTGGNINADANAHFLDEVWFVERKSGENKIFVEFELSPAFDVQGVKLPRRQTIQNVCPWRYRRWDSVTHTFDYSQSADCGYTGAQGNYTESDTPTTDPSLDKCGKRLSSCKLRFGTYATLPYGGFPGTGLIR